MVKPLWIHKILMSVKQREREREDPRKKSNKKSVLVILAFQFIKWLPARVRGILILDIFCPGPTELF